MTEQDRTLVEILAATDAIWRPIRASDWVRPGPTNFYEAQVRFASGGIHWIAGGCEASRKRSQRDLEALQQAGLLTLLRGKRRVTVKLTELAEIGLRALCGLSNVDAAHATLLRVIELSATGDAGLFGPMASELWICGLRNYSDSDDCVEKLTAVQDSLLPALGREWIVAESDCFGRTYYFATEHGREIAQAPAPALVNLPPSAASASELYHQATRDFRERLRVAKPNCPSEIGFLPLPASLNIHKPRRRRKAKGNA